MFIVPTATKRGRASESGMAGTAKIPASAATASKEELKAMAARAGWEVRPLTFEEVNKMSSSELRFHELWNKEALDRTFETESNKRHNVEHGAYWDVKRAWKEPTVEQLTKGYAAQNIFVARFRDQYEATEENGKKLVAYMAERGFDPQVSESYARAFRELIEAGQLTPKKPESADAYLANHPEMRDNRVPPIIAARNAKADATAKHFHAAANATAESGFTRVVDYPQESRGPAYSDVEKASFRNLLKNLSADEFQNRLNEDPTFRASVDRLGSEK
jgi:hypothetical protein